MNSQEQTNGHTNDEPRKIYKICLTGGPCAGKTSSLTHLKDRFSPKFIVYVLPEVAATTVGAGVTIIPSEFTPETHKVFTKGIMKMQMDLEDYFTAIASIQKKDVIILTDRGVMDNTAYCTPEVEQKIYEETGWTKGKIRDNRYDMVIHLVTAAIGAEKFYTLENNEARSETPEVASWLDKKTQAVWNGHPNHVIVDNNVANFNEKLDRVYNAICQVLEVPTTGSYHKKFLIKDFTPSIIPEECDRETFKEQITYLKDAEEGHKSWLKSRVAANGNKHLSYVKRKYSARYSERMELKRRVGTGMFGELLKQKDEGRVTLNKDLTVFIWNNRNFIVEDYQFEGGKTIQIFRYTTHAEDEKVELPPFIQAGQDISEDPEYFSYNLSDPTFSADNNGAAAQ